ncbi:MAG: hypothetical protein DCC73_07765 [Proteobacteria bacterium]|nr:MAG: hypothetical protein DCC73_07765 [Pseudomonadota bacterium]
MKYTGIFDQGLNDWIVIWSQPYNCDMGKIIGTILSNFISNYDNITNRRQATFFDLACTRNYALNSTFKQRKCIQMD